jgi:hypothetical protein
MTAGPVLGSAIEAPVSTLCAKGPFSSSSPMG